MTEDLSRTWPGGSKGTRTVIAVGAEAPRFETRATFVDGQSPVVRDVTVSFDDAAKTLVIRQPGRDPLVWPFEALRSLPDQAGKGRMLLGQAGGDTARLEVSAEDAVMIRTRAHRLTQRLSTVKRSRLFVLAVGAVASVALMILVLVPLLADRLSTVLPPEGEAALGEATFEQIRTALDQSGLGLGVTVCEAPEGRAALDAMTARLIAAAPPDLTPVNVRVLDHPMVNAFALPGGQVVLFRGLIDAAESPDEVAAVLGHEIGHVAARDPTRIALRSAGSIGVLGLLFGDFAGGAMMLFLAERIIQADYTQEAEAAADAFGAALLRDAGISPAALATFFERLRDEYGEAPEILQHFLAHPAMEDRIEATRNTPGPTGPVVPALEAESWAALQSICD